MALAGMAPLNSPDNGYGHGGGWLPTLVQWRVAPTVAAMAEAGQGGVVCRCGVLNAASGARHNILTALCRLKDMPAPLVSGVTL